MGGDYVFRAFGVDLKKAVQNISFVAACLVTALLCFTAEVYTDFSNARSYSVYEAILTLDKDAFLSDISFSSVLVFGKSLSGYISMFLPVSSAFPYITNLCSERNSGNIRFSIMRTGRLKFYFSKFGSALLSGGFSTLLGVVMYGGVVFMLFPDINAYAVTAEDTLFFFPNGIVTFIAQTLIHAFLYGCISVMPAFYLSSFCRNPYIILCVPFMVTYIWIIVLNKISCSLFVLYCYEKPQKVTESVLIEICCNWLCYAISLIFREDTKYYGGFSIPVRVTTHDCSRMA